MMTCPSSVIACSLQFMRSAGERRCECVVLWLGQRSSGNINVVSAYLPLQSARSDIFRIPAQGMIALHQEMTWRGIPFASGRSMGNHKA